MSYLTVAEIAGMRSEMSSTFLDTCKIGTKSGGAWGTDPGEKSYSYGSAIACGVDLAGQSESFDGSQATEVDAVITLPHGTTVTAVDRIKVAHRLGVDVSDLEYSIHGTPKHGLFGLICNCKLTTGASNR